MDRKTFIRKTTAGLIIGLPVVSMFSCSSGSDDGPSPSPSPSPNPQANCLQNGTQSAISANHGHTLTVSKEDVNAAVEKSYTLSQASTDNHIHEITISPTQFNTLKANNSISVTSTNQAGHTHSVTVSCA
ncbi:hypothetical protein FK178_15165 [Antarcticibacterium arcticum]|uniref:Uncharacterized protein n=1 Tax=Antarcticibacterium arcticum TaxID=2585771 RepID=A0A5B8YQJ4_9FLAO|nr:hypothetical protein [Antarcticibacterium arcticum]QED38973.1 hypothetical protein FK178_15165 [Antarcticibacterium arcticum]